MTTRYVLHDSIGSGGMATVHIGQLLAPLGFSRVVAIKRLHAALSHQPEFAAMLVDEARITARVRHINVIPTLDVFVEHGECFLVMEYVEGESLANLLRATSVARASTPLGVVSAIIVDVLHGLHAAHTARSGTGAPLNLIHRDVSPQNILVGTDGLARVFDFGVAKALGRLQQTRAGEFKGKLPYLAPEQFGERVPDQRVDIYATSVTLWEALTARRLFDGASEEEVFGKILQARIPAPSELRKDLPPELDQLVMRGLSRAPDARFASAEQMALALEAALPPAAPREVAAWLRELASEALGKRAELVSAMDSGAPAAGLSAATSFAPISQAITAVSSNPSSSPQDFVADTEPIHAPEWRDTASEAKTIVARAVAPGPAKMAAAPEARRKRFVLPVLLGAVLLPFLLAAPAFGWMALADHTRAPAAGASASRVAAAMSVAALEPGRPTTGEPLLNAAGETHQPTAFAEAAAKQELRPRESTAKLPTPEIKPAAHGSKARPPATADYLSSRAFSQRR